MASNVSNIHKGRGSGLHRHVLVAGEDRFVVFRLMWVEGAEGVFLASLHDKNGVVDRRVLPGSTKPSVTALMDQWRKGLPGLLAVIDPPPVIGRIIDDAKWDLDGERRNMFTAPAYLTGWHQRYSRVYLRDPEIELLVTTKFASLTDAVTAVNAWKARVKNPEAHPRIPAKRRLDWSAVPSTSDRHVRQRVESPAETTAAKTPMTSTPKPASQRLGTPSGQAPVAPATTTTTHSAEGAAETPAAASGPQSSSSGASTEDTVFPSFLTAAQKRGVKRAIFGKRNTRATFVEKWHEPGLSKRERVRRVLEKYPDGNVPDPELGDRSVPMEDSRERLDRTGRNRNKVVTSSDEEEDVNPSFNHSRTTDDPSAVAGSPGNRPSTLEGASSAEADSHGNRSSGTLGKDGEEEKGGNEASTETDPERGRPPASLETEGEASSITDPATDRSTVQPMEEEEDPVKEVVVAEQRRGPISPVRHPSPASGREAGASSGTPSLPQRPPRSRRRGNAAANENEEAWQRNVARLLHFFPEDVRRQPPTWWASKDVDELLRSVRGSILRRKLDRATQAAEEEAEEQGMTERQRKRHVEEAVAEVQDDIRRENDLAYSPLHPDSDLAVARKFAEDGTRKRLADVKRIMGLMVDNYPIEGVLAEMEIIEN